MDNKKQNIYNAIQNLYNMDFKSWQEVLSMLYNLVADVEMKFEVFENKFYIALGKEVTFNIKEMVKNGTLGTLINGTLLNNIINDITSINNDLDDTKKYFLLQLQNKANLNDIAMKSNGTPLFASNVEQMTDKTRNYVNTNDNFIYVFNNGQWSKTDIQYQARVIPNKSITNTELSDDIRLSPNALINLDENLIDVKYLNNPLSFIKWYSPDNFTIIEDTFTRLNNFKSINIKSTSNSVQWIIFKEIPFNTRGKITFSFLRKSKILNHQNINAVDNNGKWYGGAFEVEENYYKNWDLVKYSIIIDTDIKNISFYVGNSKGENNYNIALFSISTGEYKSIIPKWTMDNLDDDIQNLLNKQDNKFTIENLGGLINDKYSRKPLNFITWSNGNTCSMNESEIIVNDYLALNVTTNIASGVNYLNSININNPSKGIYTFSCLIKTIEGKAPFIDMMDNNNKFYKNNGATTEIINNYFNGYDLYIFNFEVITNISKLIVLIGYNSNSNFNIGMYTLHQNDKQLIVIDNQIVTYEKLDYKLKNIVDEVNSNLTDVLNCDLLLPRKIFMIDNEPLRLYKKNIVFGSNNVRNLELSVTSYKDSEFWNNATQPYVEYVNDKLELKTENVYDNKIKFTLVGNDLGSRLSKTVEVVSKNVSSMINDMIIVNMFGDSTSQNGLTYAVSKILSKYVNRKMIGTKTINGVPAEARGGWLYQQYIGYRTTNSHDDKPITNGDFPNFLKLATIEDKNNKGDWCYTRTGSAREKTYNEIKNNGGNINQDFYIFDYAHYLKINKFEKPHFVTLGMGINDEWKYPNDYLTLCEKALNIIIRQIYEASPNTKFILQPFPTKGSNEVKVEWFKKCLELETYFKNMNIDIEIVAEHLSQNKDLFFPSIITSLPNKIADKDIINDAIHTTLEGYVEGAKPIVYCMLNKI